MSENKIEIIEVRRGEYVAKLIREGHRYRYANVIGVVYEELDEVGITLEMNKNLLIRNAKRALKEWIDEDNYPRVVEVIEVD